MIKTVYKNPIINQNILELLWLAILGFLVTFIYVFPSIFILIILVFTLSLKLLLNLVSHIMFIKWQEMNLERIQTFISIYEEKIKETNAFIKELYATLNYITQFRLFNSKIFEKKDVIKFSQWEIYYLRIAHIMLSYLDSIFNAEFNLIKTIMNLIITKSEKNNKKIITNTIIKKNFLDNNDKKRITNQIKKLQFFYLQNKSVDKKIAVKTIKKR